MSAPPIEYLFGCTDSELRRFILHKMERAALLEKERKEVVEELLETRVTAEVAVLLLDTRRLSATGHPIQKSLDFAEGTVMHRTAAD